METVETVDIMETMEIDETVSIDCTAWTFESKRCKRIWKVCKPVLVVGVALRSYWRSRESTILRFSKFEPRPGMVITSKSKKDIFSGISRLKQHFLQGFLTRIGTEWVRTFCEEDWKEHGKSFALDFKFLSSVGKKRLLKYIKNNLIRKAACVFKPAFVMSELNTQVLFSTKYKKIPKNQILKFVKWE